MESKVDGAGIVQNGADDLLDSGFGGGTEWI